MIITQIGRSEFKKCEQSTVKKILLNICDYLIYGLTDSNHFYRNLYVNPKNDYDNCNHSLGSVFYSEILSYHIVANLVCVELPKTNYNIKPFKLNYFNQCCKKISDYITKHDIKEIHTPIFGTKILEGDWNSIVDIMKNHFKDNDLERIVIYE